MKEYPTVACFSVDDIERARKFYSETLDLGSNVHTYDDALLVDTAGNTQFYVYEKADHKPAEHTVLVFSVPDIEGVVSELSQKGVAFQQLEGTNEKGIAGNGSSKSAWFKDPAGNWIALHQGN